MTSKSAKWLHRVWSALAIALLIVAASPVQATETLTFIHTDVAGSPVAATDINGDVIWREGYRPYGERTKNESAAAGNRQFFHGKAFDADTGLSYFGARYYDPLVGRFMGVDAVGFREDNIHSFNRYAYGNNNPYKYIDSDGRYADKILFIGIAVGTYVYLGGYQAAKPQPGLQGFPASNDSGLTILTTPGSAVSGNQLPGFSELADKIGNLIFSRGNKVEPAKDADAEHTTWKTDPRTGEITRHETWTPNPRNPSGWDSKQSTDVVGRPHTNKDTGERVSTPHTQGKSIPGGVRPATPDEIPGSRQQ